MHQLYYITLPARAGSVSLGHYIRDARLTRHAEKVHPLMLYMQCLDSCQLSLAQHASLRAQLPFLKMTTAMNHTKRRAFPEPSSLVPSQLSLL
jgi:hypothetical protein